MGSMMLGMTSCSSDDKEVSSYEVTFDSQGGSKVHSQNVKSGEKVIEPTRPTKDGSIFIAWYSVKTDTANKKFDFNAVITRDTTLYALWKSNGGESIPDNCIPKLFSVSATKKVYFTKSNLYWNGNAFRFESNQTDYPTSRDANHVGHFYWTKTASASYAQTYNDGTRTATDRFFADGMDANHMLNVEGTANLYVLSKDEWSYLLNRSNNLYKCNVTVNGVDTCLIIAPDDYDYLMNPLKNTYNTLDEVNTLGLVCLPPAGSINETHSESVGKYGVYMSSDPYNTSTIYDLEFDFKVAIVTPADMFNRSCGHSIRAVCAKN